MDGVFAVKLTRQDAGQQRPRTSGFVSAAHSKNGHGWRFCGPVSTSALTPGWNAPVGRRWGRRRATSCHWSSAAEEPEGVVGTGQSTAAAGRRRAADSRQVAADSQQVGAGLVQRSLGAECHCRFAAVAERVARLSVSLVVVAGVVVAVPATSPTLIRLVPRQVAGSERRRPVLAVGSRSRRVEEERRLVRPPARCWQGRALVSGRRRPAERQPGRRELAGQRPLSPVVAPCRYHTLVGSVSGSRRGRAAARWRLLLTQGPDTRGARRWASQRRSLWQQEAADVNRATRLPAEVAEGLYACHRKPVGVA